MGSSARSVPHESSHLESHQAVSTSHLLHYAQQYQSREWRAKHSASTLDVALSVSSDFTTSMDSMALRDT